MSSPTTCGSLKNGLSNAYLGVILVYGLLSNRRFKKFNTEGLMSLHYSLSNRSHTIFLSKKLSDSTLNGSSPTISWYAITPKEYISQAWAYFWFSPRPMISGAIYPIVPHLSYKYYWLLLAARPKSPMTHLLSSSLKITFYGLISLCIIWFSSKYASPDRMSLIADWINYPVRIDLFFNVSSRVPPDKYSVTKYTKDYVS